jgi:hypothetical protein
MSRTILTLSAFAAAMITAPPAAKAWATYVSAAQDNLTMIVTAITDTNYAMAGQHTAFATAWVSSPTGRTSQNTIFHANVAIASTFLPIDPEEGEFTIGNIEPKEFCPLANVTYYLSPVYSPETVERWIRLERITGPETQIGLTNSTRSATVEIQTSPNCQGDVTIFTTLAKNPNEIGADISADVPDGDGNYYPNGAESSKSMPGGTAYAFKFTVKTTHNNTTEGFLRAIADIYRHPGCQLKGPSQGQSNVKSWEVK